MKNFYKKIQTIRSVLKMLLLGCFMFVGSIAYTYGQTAFVTTDKPDYLVNQEVTITGTGFQSSEIVILTITDFITKAEILSFWVFCQPDGSFTASMILVNSDKIHKLIARGETSGRTAQVLYNNLPLINFTGSGIPDFERIYINLQYTDRHNLSIERGVNFTLGPNNPLPDIPCYPGTTFNYSEVKTCDFGIIVGPIPENCYGFLGGTPASGFTVTYSSTDIELNFCSSFPLITNWPHITVSNDPGKCSAVIEFTGSNAIIATSDPEFDPVIITYDPPSGSTFPLGQSWVNATIANGCFQYKTRFPVYVTETEPPTFLSNFPANRTAFTLPGKCGNVIGWPVPTATDNCPGTVTVEQIAGLPSGSDFPVGVTTVSYRATDVSGNLTEKSFTITIVDNQPPVAPADIEITVECPQQTISLPTPPIATDNCSGNVAGILTETTSTYDPESCEGKITRKYSYTDDSGNKSYSYHTYIIDRTVAPGEVGGPVPTDGGTIECIADAKPPHLVIANLPEVRDVCGTLIPNYISIRTEVTYNPNSGCEGTIIYVYTYEDCAGLTFDWKYTYSIVRTTPPHEVGGPVATAKTIKCPSEVVAPTFPQVADVCGIPILSFKTPVEYSGTYRGCEGTIIQTYIWEDCAGKQFKWSFTYTIDRDDLSIPESETGYADCVGEAVEPDAPPTVSDGCEEWVNPTGPTIQENIVDGKGTKTYTWIYTDCTGKDYLWTYKYNIEDKTPPEMNCPTEPVLVDNEPGTCYAEFNMTNLNDFPNGDLSFLDNCSEAQIADIESSWSYESGNIRRLTIGDRTIKILITDASGNENTCEYSLTVLDKDAPEIVCPENISVGTNLGCRYVGSIGTATANDLCTRESLIKISNNAPLAFEIGTTLVTWTAEDAAGNKSSCTQLVTVSDDDTPEISCPPDITQKADAGNCGAVVTYEANATDNCSAEVTYIPLSGSFFPVGITQVTAKASDPAGNKNQCIFNVTVTNSAPEIHSLTPDLSLIPLNTLIAMSVDYSDQEDNITATSINWGDGTETPGTTPSHIYSSTGVFPVTVTVTDACGLSDVEIYEYIVVYDPTAGFVTGGGWIESPQGAYPADPTLTGRANFGFVAKYLNGKSIPDGNTEFQFKAGNLNFKSVNYAWLVISGTKAQFKGTGTINGSGNYGFLLSASDGDLANQITTDKFRIKIWDKDAGDAIIYDNEINNDEIVEATSAIAGGSIVIHLVKIKSAEIFTEIKPAIGYANLEVYPNPFSDKLHFEFVSSKSGHTSIEIFDITGRKIKTIFNGPTDGGMIYNAEFKPESMISGIYIYRIAMGEAIFDGQVIYKK